jgi:hypothetical protein
METNLQNKNEHERRKFIIECMFALKQYTYSDDDESIIDKNNLLNYLLKHYSKEYLFTDLNSKKVANIIKELRDIEMIEDMFYYPVTLEEIIVFYYIGFLYHNKYNIIKYLSRWL